MHYERDTGAEIFRSDDILIYILDVGLMSVLTPTKIKQPDTVINASGALQPQGLKCFFAVSSARLQASSLRCEISSACIIHVM